MIRKTLTKAGLTALLAVFAATFIANQQGALAQDSSQEAAASEAGGAYTPEEQARFEALVRDYLLRNPDVVIEAIQEFQRRQQRLEAEAKTLFLEERRAEIFEHPQSPVMGEGPITIVEFFDYRCPYCRRMADGLQELLKTETDTRLVFKELPVLGQESYVAARWALAVARQGKYEDFHFALMTQPGDMSEAHLSALSEELGLDVAQIKADMADTAIDEERQRNRLLSDGLGVTGTPAFVIGDAVIPGAVPIAQLKELIREQREGGS